MKKSLRYHCLEQSLETLTAHVYPWGIFLIHSYIFLYWMYMAGQAMKYMNIILAGISKLISQYSSQMGEKIRCRHSQANKILLVGWVIFQINFYRIKFYTDGFVLSDVQVEIEELAVSGKWSKKKCSERLRTRLNSFKIFEFVQINQMYCI